MALTTLSFVKNVLGISTSTKDTQYSSLLSAAEREIKRYLQQEIESGTYTEYHTGNNTSRIALRQIPVTSITAVYLKSDGYYDTKSPGFTSDVQLTEGTDFVLDRGTDGTISKSGIIFKLGTVWPMLYRTATVGKVAIDIGPCFGNIKVIYTAGYNPVPEDIQLACAFLTQRYFRTANYGGVMPAYEKLGDYAYGLSKTPSSLAGTGGVPELGTILTLLAPYKEIGW